MKYTYIYTSFALFSLSTISVFAAGNPPQLDCQYAGKFEECWTANQNGNARSIEDFICLDRAGSWQQVLSQIILDEKFKELDEEVSDYLKKLEDSKWEYFGADKNASVLRGIDDVYKQFTEFWYFWEKYMDLCEWWVLAEMADCGDGVLTTEAKDFLWGPEATSCKTLARSKINIARNVAGDILTLNKVAVRKDERKEFVKEERTKYDELLDMMRTIVWYMERFMNGWPTKTKVIDN